MSLGSPAIAYADALTASFPVAEYATTTPAIIARYSALYGIESEEIAKTIQCESEGNERAYNPHDHLGGAKGIAQFLQPTFDKYSALAGVESPNVWDKADAIQVMSYMFSIGEARQWTCYRSLYL